MTNIINDALAGILKQSYNCHKKMDEKTGLCTNPKCVRSQPLHEKKGEKKDGEKA